MVWIEKHFNENGLCECIRKHRDEKVIYEAYMDYDEHGDLIRVTSSNDIWYDYYQEADYYERSMIFDRNRRY